MRFVCPTHLILIDIILIFSLEDTVITFSFILLLWIMRLVILHNTQVIIPRGMF
jgi:hypothetical protein